MGQPKKEKEGPGLGLKRLPLAKPTQQPTKNNTSDGAGFLTRFGRGRTLGEDNYPSFLMVFERPKKIHSVTAHGPNR
jgi:hypothetical protein